MGSGNSLVSNSGLRTFRRGTSIVATCCQLSRGCAACGYAVGSATLESQQQQQQQPRPDRQAVEEAAPTAQKRRRKTE